MRRLHTVSTHCGMESWREVVKDETFKKTKGKDEIQLKEAFRNSLWRENGKPIPLSLLLRSNCHFPRIPLSRCPFVRLSVCPSVRWVLLGQRVLSKTMSQRTRRRNSICPSVCLSARLFRQRIQPGMMSFKTLRRNYFCPSIHLSVHPSIHPFTQPMSGVNQPR